MLRWVVKEVESPYGSVATMHWAVVDGNDDSNDDTIMKDADTGHALLEQQLESSEDQLGAVLWNSNTVALQYLHDHVLCDKKRCYHVVELGAGVGCLGIALAMAGAHVVITDLKELVPLMQKNIELNADRIQSRSNGQGTCKALALRWGPVPKPKKQQKENTPPLAERIKDTSPYEVPSPPFLALQEELGHIDVVVLCDALYGNPKHWPQLLYTLSEILLTNPTCEIMNFCEQRVDDVEGDFLKLLQEENTKTLLSDASEEDEDEVKKKKKEKSLEDALTRMRGAYEWWTSTEVVGEGKSDLNMTVRATRIRWVRRGRKRNVTSSSSLSPPMRGNDDVEDCEKSPQRKRRRAES